VCFGCSLQALAGLSADGPSLRRLFPGGAARGQTVEVTAAGEAPQWPVSIWSDDPAIRWEALADKGKFRVTVDPGAGLGVHHVRFYDKQNATDALRFVVGPVAECNEQEPNDSLSKAQVVATLPQTINGVLEKRGEVDTFAVDLAANQTLVAALDATRSLRSPVDATLQIVSPRGIVLAQNLDTLELDPRIVFTAKSAGKYSIRVFGFPETPDSTISFGGGDTWVYRLTLTNSGWLAAAQPLAVSGIEATTVQPLVVGGQTAQPVTVPAVAISDIPKPFPLHIANVAASVLPLDVLTIPLQGEPRVAADQASPVLNLPVSMTGCLDQAQQVDRYRFSAKKGDKLRFALHARQFGLPIDGVLRIVDADGKQLAREDDTQKTADCTLNWTAPSEGTFVLEVSDAFGKGGAEWLYRVDMQAVQSDVRLTVKSDHFQGKVNQPLEVVVAIDRRDGFAEPVSVSVAGMPAALKADAVVSQKEGDSAKEVKLQIVATESFSGPIRIFGEVNGQAPGKRWATAAGDPLLGDFWLTFQ